MTTVEEALIYEAGLKSSAQSPENDDSKEVFNYKKAVFTALDELKKYPINENLIKNIHGVLMDSVRGAKMNPGNYKTKQNRIVNRSPKGDELVWLPPPPTQMPELMNNWCKYVNDRNREKDPLVMIGAAHYQFEAIHPFEDGNGRIGRLLIPILLLYKDILPWPCLYISEYFEENKDEYYDRLKEVADGGRFENWIVFFLKALSNQALRTLNTIGNINRLFYDYLVILQDSELKHGLTILSLIQEKPVLTAKDIKQILNTSNVTVYKYLKRFEELGILSQLEPEKRKNKLYLCRPYLDILSS